MKVLFLDVDGVLNAHRKGRNGFCYFEPVCVENLNKILFSITDLQIVISSSWRYMIEPSVMTLLGFEYLLIVSGVACKARILGMTTRDKEIPGRADQIKRWLDEHPDVTKHLALDDLDWDFPSRKIVSLQTDGYVGLTEESAQEIINYFNS